jgi:hypothetical protein
MSYLHWWDYAYLNKILNEKEILSEEKHDEERKTN